MLIETLQTLFQRDISKLRSEIAAYKLERNIWITDKAIANSGGNLCLHLIGNLNAYIGAELGKSGYVRQRDLEFSLKDIARSKLIAGIEETMSVVHKTLSSLTDETMKGEYPLLVFEKKTSTAYFLVHLATHWNYHLGQVNYHRRLLDVA